MRPQDIELRRMGNAQNEPLIANPNQQRQHNDGKNISFHTYLMDFLRTLDSNCYCSGQHIHWWFY